MGAWCYSTREEREMWMSTFATRLRNDGTRKKLMEKLEWGVERLDAAADACENWIEAEDGCFGLIHGELIITKA